MKIESARSNRLSVAPTESPDDEAIATPATGAAIVTRMASNTNASVATIAKIPGERSTSNGERPLTANAANQGAHARIAARETRRRPRRRPEVVNVSSWTRAAAVSQ